MAGLLTPSNQQAQQGQPAPAQEASPVDKSQAGPETLNDPVLKQIEQGIEEKIPPDLKDAYLAIVVSGMQVMFSKETSELLDKTLSMQGDMVSNIAQGIAKLLTLVYNESKKSVPEGGEGGMDVRMAVPAGITLMCQALDYAEQTKGVEITPEMAAEATKQTMMATLKAFGISEDQVNQTIQAGQQQGGAGQDQGAPTAPVAQPVAGA